MGFRDVCRKPLIDPLNSHISWVNTSKITFHDVFVPFRPCHILTVRVVCLVTELVVARQAQNIAVATKNVIGANNQALTIIYRVN